MNTSWNVPPPPRPPINPGAPNILLESEGLGLGSPKSSPGTASDGGTLPHLEDPLTAPRPYKVDLEVQKNLMSDMARNLDEQGYGQPRMQPQHSFHAPPANYNSGYHPGGFSPLPPPIQQPWAPWSPALPTPPHQPAMSPAPLLPYPRPGSQYPQYDNRPGGFDGLQPPQVGPTRRAVSPAPTISAHVQQPQTASDPPSLTAPLPTIPALLTAMPTTQNPNHDPALRVAWVRDVLFLVERAHAQATGSPVGEPANGPFTDNTSKLAELGRIAVAIILEMVGQPGNVPPSTPPYIPEMIFHRASLLSSGLFPPSSPNSSPNTNQINATPSNSIARNPRQAFRDFEIAARAGYARAWFRLGRDYEGFGDFTRARECFERGARGKGSAGGEAGCLYRLGMAHLLGQLTLPASPETALPLLQRAALLSTVDTPQPAYVYALLLMGEFNPGADGQAPKFGDDMFLKLGLIPQEYAHMQGSSGVLLTARPHLLLSAYLHFSPAQYKLGHAYEFASPPFEFDALLSVEWYSRASQQGEIEADMALSKWFLCGSRVGGPNGEPPDPSLGGFDKDEQLARVFAEKAARKGLPSAEFAMGYYCEVGIGNGGVRTLDEAVAWYRKAEAHGNTDAIERLAALTQSVPQMLSRQEHDSITESKLVRTRTQAKQRSEAQKVRDGYLATQNQGQGPPQGPQGGPPGGPVPAMGGPPGYNAAGPGYGYPGGPGGAARRQDSRPVVELIRKNTLTYANQGPGPGPVHGRYPTEHANTLPPGGHRPMSAQGGPGGPNVPQGMGPGVGLRPPRQTSMPGQPGQPAQAFAGANRYTLVDPGARPAPNGESRSDSRSPSGGPSGRRPAPRRGPSGGVSIGGGTGAPGADPGPGGPVGAPSSDGISTPPKAAGPQTFAEMGFTGAKVEEDKCVIM